MPHVKLDYFLLCLHIHILGMEACRCWLWQVTFVACYLEKWYIGSLWDVMGKAADREGGQSHQKRQEQNWRLKGDRWCRPN